MARRPFIPFILILMVALAACGGGSDDAADDTTTTAAEPADNGDDAPATTTTEPATTIMAEPSDEGSDSEGGVAVVEIGDFRYEFNATPGSIRRCDPNFFNAFWVVGISGDGMSGDTVEMLLPPEGDPNHTDAPRVEVTDQENGIDWIANPDSMIANADQTKVDSWTVDGNRVEGTATFLRAGDTNDGELVSGTFEVVCPPEE